MKLLINWEKFKNQTQHYIDEANELLSNYKFRVSNNQESNLGTSIDNWRNKLIAFLDESFDTWERSYYMPLSDYKRNEYQKIRVDESIQLEQGKIKYLNDTLGYIDGLLTILSASDYIINTENIDEERRKYLTTDEIIELLLIKLYFLYGDNYVPIDPLMIGNGILLRNKHFPSELAQYMKSIGFVYVIEGYNVTAQLTIEGKRHVENNLLIRRSNYSEISDDPDLIGVKIDKILEMVNKQGLGQEILFEELENMKSIYYQLSKKDWGQLLKGKLIDLGLEKLINMEMANLIYRELTNQILLIK